MSYTNAIAAPGPGAFIEASKGLGGQDGTPADFGSLMEKAGQGQAGGLSPASDASTAAKDVLAVLREILDLLGKMQGASPASQPQGAEQAAPQGAGQAAPQSAAPSGRPEAAQAAQAASAQAPGAADAGGDMLSQLMALLQKLGFKGETPAEMAKGIKDELGKLEDSGRGNSPIAKLLGKIATALESMGGQEGASQAGSADPGQETGRAAPSGPAANQADGATRAADAVQRALDRARDDLARNDLPGALADLKQGQKEAMAALQGMPPMQPGNTNDLAPGFFGRCGAESLVSGAGRPTQAAAV